MGSKIGETIKTWHYYGTAGVTDLYATVYDEAGNPGTTTAMTELGTTGLYYYSWSPDAAGVWLIKITRTGAAAVMEGYVYHVSMGQETTIREVSDVVLYIGAEDMGTTEGTDDGTAPALLSEVSKTCASESAAQSDPAWSEDWSLEQFGTTTILSIYYDLEWQMKRTGGSTSYAKWQISGDGGTTWVDVTDNVAETSASYADKTRLLAGLHVSSIAAGANKLQLRLCAWTDGTSVETKIRTNSYIRLVYRKS